MSEKMKDLPDDLLLDKQRQGDAGAYNVLFKRYYDALYGYALKNVKDSFVAEELTMDVLLRLWQKKGEVEVTNDLKAYLFRSIKNAIYNHYRKKILATVPLEVETASTLTSVSADDALQTKELEQFYVKKLAQLSPQRRQVFQMSREENMTYPEIAKNMNLSVNTVENYMVATLRFFRKEIKEHADFIIVFLISIFFR